MKKTVLFAAILLIVGCAGPLASSGPGWIHTDVKEAVQANNGTAITKRGQACATNILGIVSSGDSTVDAAKKAAGVSSVATIDRSYWSILGIYAKACTLVAGN